MAVAETGKKSRKQYFKDYRNRQEVKAQRKEYGKKYRKENKDKIKIKVSDWGKKNKRRKKATEIQRRYGISLEDYDKLFEQQKGVCAICNKGMSRGLDIDHNHITGQIRGLLCNPCNQQLGIFEKRFDEFINYLERY